MDETTSGVPEQISDELAADALDDVEAHGLREVAAAAGIGAAVLGGGGAALAASGGSGAPLPPVTQGVHQIVQDGASAAQGTDAGTRSMAGSVQQGIDNLQAVRDARATTGAVAGAVGGTVDTTAGQAAGLAGIADAGATSITAETLSGARMLAGDSVGVAGNALRGPVTTADNEVVVTTNVTDHALTAADRAAIGAVGKASTTVHRAEKSVLDIVSAVRGLAGHGWTLDMSVLGTSAKAGGTTLAPTGTVSIIDEAGKTLASANLADGRCSLNVAGTNVNQNLTIRYGGDGHYAQSSLRWVVPPIT